MWIQLETTYAKRVHQLKAAVGGHEALLDSNLVFQLLVHSLGISGFKLDPHYCQLPVAEEVQPDRNSCPAVLTVVWIVLDSNYTRQTSDNLSINRTAFYRAWPSV